MAGARKPPAHCTGPWMARHRTRCPFGPPGGRARRPAAAQGTHTAPPPVRSRLGPPCASPPRAVVVPRRPDSAAGRPRAPCPARMRHEMWPCMQARCGDCARDEAGPADERERREPGVRLNGARVRSVAPSRAAAARPSGLHHHAGCGWPRGLPCQRNVRPRFRLSLLRRAGLHHAAGGRHVHRQKRLLLLRRADLHHAAVEPHVHRRLSPSTR